MPLPKALYWAINAKNTFQIRPGFLSYQLVFKRNPKITSTLTENPPALDGAAINHLFAKHIHAIHSARSAFIDAESSKKVDGLYKQNLELGLYVLSRETKFFTREMIQNARRVQELS